MGPNSTINNIKDLTTPEHQQETNSTKAVTETSDVLDEVVENSSLNPNPNPDNHSSVNISTTDSDPAKTMDLPPGFVASNESVDEINNDDLQIANQASLSQTQIIIIGGAGGGCLLIILVTSMVVTTRRRKQRLVNQKQQKNAQSLFPQENLGLLDEVNRNRNSF